jgi:hypothetical protein
MGWKNENVFHGIETKNEENIYSTTSSKTSEAGKIRK